MIVPVQNMATLQITGSVRVSEVYDWAGLIDADAFVEIEGNTLIARWSSILKDEMG